MKLKKISLLLSLKKNKYRFLYNPNCPIAFETKRLLITTALNTGLRGAGNPG